MAVETKDLGKWKTRMEERIVRLKNDLLDSPQKLDTERFKFLKEVYQETEGEPAVIRRAKLFQRALENKSIYIDDNPIIGTSTKTVAGVYPYPEWSCRWMKKDVESLSHLGKVHISDEDRKLLDEVVDYWSERCVFTQTNKLFEEQHGFSPIPALKAGLFISGTDAPQGGGIMDYPVIINKGLNGIANEVQEKLKAISVKNTETKKINFYRAVLIILQAVKHFSHRYADLATEMSSKETDAERKEELLEIARICRWVPENPARTFREGVQSMWFMHLCLAIEQSGCGYSPGRIGQYLDPLYQRDKQEGRVTEEEAKVLFKFLFIKLQEIGLYRGQLYFQAASAHVGQTITVGGLTPKGEDATTELDMILLDVQKHMHNIQPTISLFYHNKMKDDILLKAIELVRTGVGQPQFMNNEIAVERSLDRDGIDGAKVQDARNCGNFGCVGTGIAGETAFPIEGEVNIAKAFELALNNGKDPLTGEQIGPETGKAETFGSYEELFDAFAKQLDFAMIIARSHGFIGDMLIAENLPVPLRSVLTGGCIERGMDVWDGGANYNSSMLIVAGGIDAANSLVAVKKLVYEEKRLTLSELKAVLAKNFAGNEEIWKMCADAPKHGNDDDAVTAIVRSVYDAVDASYHKVGSDYLGKTGKPQAYSLTMHNHFGARMGALPTGRLAGIALTDGSVSAMPGTDTNGPTALANSAALALDTVRFASNHFNMKFHPSALEGPNGARNLLALVKGYMDQGGSHIQFNCVSSDALKDAQLHPESYRDLVVRVAGFSAYFTRLDKGVQDEIIKRTELKFN